jgi:hypothetical protein
MNKNDLIKLGAEKLSNLLIEFGHIIRKLDTNCEYIEYWTNDGEYLSDLILIKGD